MTISLVMADKLTSQSSQLWPHHKDLAQHDLLNTSREKSFGDVLTVSWWSCWSYLNKRFHPITGFSQNCPGPAGEKPPTLLCHPSLVSVHSAPWPLTRAALGLLEWKPHFVSHPSPVALSQGCPGPAGEKTPLCSVSHPSPVAFKPGLPWASWRENPTLLCLPSKAWSVHSAPCGLPPGLSRAIWRKIAIHSSSACHWSPVTGS